MMNSISNGMVGGMVSSHKIAITMVGLSFTLSKSMHSQAVVMVAMQALGAPVWVANPGGVHTKGGMELTIGQGKEEEEENRHGRSQAQS